MTTMTLYCGLFSDQAHRYTMHRNKNCEKWGDEESRVSDSELQGLGCGMRSHAVRVGPRRRSL